MPRVWRRPAVGAINVVALIWLGLLLGMAFVDATLKFHVPELSRVAAFSLGKKSFTLLNHIEIALAGCVAMLMLMRRLRGAPEGGRIFFVVVLAILGLQTLWLMPALVERIDLIVAGQEPPKSSIHIVYVLLEVLKTLSILGLGLYSGPRRPPESIG